MELVLCFSNKLSHCQRDDISNALYLLTIIASLEVIAL